MRGRGGLRVQGRLEPQAARPLQRRVQGRRAPRQAGGEQVDRAEQDDFASVGLVDAPDRRLGPGERRQRQEQAHDEGRKAPADGGAHLWHTGQKKLDRPAWTVRRTVPRQRGLGQGSSARS